MQNTLNTGCHSHCCHCHCHCWCQHNNGNMMPVIYGGLTGTVGSNNPPAYTPLTANGNTTTLNNPLKQL